VHGGRVARIARGMNEVVVCDVERLPEPTKTRAVPSDELTGCRANSARAASVRVLSWFAARSPSRVRRANVEPRVHA